MRQVMIIGDVGGWASRLAAAVEPALDDVETVVIQVGDLIHRGPDSAGVLAIVGERLERAPERWIQLIGNHESQYVDDHPFWPVRLSADDGARLRSWWWRDRLRVAAAVRTADGEDLLVTHAGLTVDAWRRIGEPVRAATAADLLNTRPDDVLWADDGPLWAEASTVYGSWLACTDPVPFSQVHGHSSIVDYRGRRWTCQDRIRHRSTVDWAARHTTTRMHGARFIGVDPRHGRTGAPQWAPLTLPGATLLA
jgi:hypothetical protein